MPGQASPAQKLTLPSRETDGGLECRVLLAECKGPSFSLYSAANAKKCMQLMHSVLWNRVANHKPFMAKDGTLSSVIKAPGQFAGFEKYPNYDQAIAHNIQGMLDIANSSRDQRSGTFTSHIKAAIEVANAQATTDPSPGKLSAWRTVGSGSPGSNFSLYITLAGIDFYYI